jgi:uncharacterized protein (DUF58 family)
VNGSDRLVPPAVEAATHASSRVAVAFGPRFFLLLAIGLIWIVPAFVDLRLGYAMLAWDSLVLVAWAADLARLPRPADLRVTRSWRGPTALSVPCDIELTLANSSGVPVRAIVLDALPQQLCTEPPVVEVRSAARGRATAVYTIHPRERGDVTLGDVWVRYRGLLGIAERRVKAPVSQQVRVYPNLDEARRQALSLVRSRQTALERRVARTRGAGREFESLREYREGDEFRDVCWTATARRGRLVTRTYQIERSQTIWLVIDSGRLMRARIGDLSKLDYAVNAALSVAQVALATGDRVGLLAYGRAIHHRVPAARGSAHLRLLVEQLATVREEMPEADHLLAAGRLLTDQKRRCLVVWLTDLAETSMTPEVVEAAQMMPRHLVLFVAIGQPDLSAMAAREPETAQAMYQTAAAQEMAHRREMLLARMRDRGVLTMEAESASLSPTLVNAYLSIKERNRI